MDIDLVLSGSGMLFPCHLGAYAYLESQGVNVKRVAGTSGGSIVAAGIAHGWSAERAMDIALEIVKEDILDPNWMPWRGVGLFKGDKILKLISRHLPGTMGEAIMPWGAFVSDIWKRQGVFVSSEIIETEVAMMLGIDLKTADVVRASISIPFWFKNVQLKAHPQTDGGVKLNFGMGVFDDIPERPTIGLRFKSTSGTERRTKGVIDTVAAVLSMFMDNANDTYVSKKRWPFVIETKSAGESMDFSVDEDWIKARYEEGWRAAEERWPSILEACDGIC